MLRWSWLVVWVLLVGVMAPASQAAATTQPLSEIRSAVERFLQVQSPRLGGHREIRVGHLDSRLRLTRCSVPLTPFLPAGGWRSGNVTVGVKCTGHHPWTLYVTASVRKFEDIVVAARALHRDLILTIDDLELARRDTTDLRNGYFTSIQDALSLRLRRTVAQGAYLKPSAVAKRIAVKRGEQVTLIAGGGLLVVRSAGEALADGARGEVIPVRNSVSQKIVDGVVVAQGLVRVRS